jgi:hypothetical protein
MTRFDRAERYQVGKCGLKTQIPKPWSQSTFGEPFLEESVYVCQNAAEPEIESRIKLDFFIG